MILFFISWPLTPIITTSDGYFSNWQHWQKQLGSKESPPLLAQGEIRSFRVRLYSGFITETQVSANGNLNNRCRKHLCMLRFRKCGLTETHSLNSRIRKFSETAELLLSAMFPLSVKSTDKQQSNNFRQRIKRTVGCYDTLGNVHFRKQNFLFLIGNPVGRWMFNSGETQ